MIFFWLMAYGRALWARVRGVAVASATITAPDPDDARAVLIEFLTTLRDQAVRGEVVSLEACAGQPNGECTLALLGCLDADLHLAHINALREMLARAVGEKLASKGDRHAN